MVVVTSITIILLGFITISLVRSQQSASLISVGEILLADLKQQQLKAMIGDTEGKDDSSAYGVYFASNQYTLFYGTTYDSDNSANVVINLDPNLQFDMESRTDVIFDRKTGEIYQFSNGPDYIILLDITSGKSKKIIFNRYGVIINVN